jgi:HAD superfamily hydrolase (TIGR01509 family)
MSGRPTEPERGAGAATGVIFDVDGTLVDTTYLHVLAWSRAFRDAGYQVAMSTIHRLIGMSSDRVIEEAVGELPPGLDDGHSRYFGELKREMVAFPRAADLLREVARRRARVVLATSAKPDDVGDLERVIDAADAIDHVTSSADVEEGKPAPRIFEVALEEAGLDPTRALVVGDTAWDVEAAAGCDLPCVCVLTGGLSRDELVEAGAAAVYADVADLLSHLDASPVGELLRRRDDA